MSERVSERVGEWLWGEKAAEESVQKNIKKCRFTPLSLYPMCRFIHVLMPSPHPQSLLAEDSSRTSVAAPTAGQRVS